MSGKLKRQFIQTGAGIALLVIVGWLYFWFGPFSTHLAHTAQKKHPISMAIVTKVADTVEAGAVGRNAYRVSILSYKALDGQMLSMERELPWNVREGGREPIVLRSDGKVYVYRDLSGFQPKNPRHPSKGWRIIICFTALAIGALIWFGTYRLLNFLWEVWPRVKRLRISWG